MVAAAVAQGVPQPVFGLPMGIRFATHDATTTALNTPQGLPEAWVDVKATGSSVPGQGWTFSVGTVGVTTTQVVDSPKFSGEDIEPSPLNFPRFRVATPTQVSAAKQVVVLQARGPLSGGGDNGDQGIKWQRYLYGDTGIFDGPVSRTATNARAVSVWPVVTSNGDLDEAETRIAICGETYEGRLPKNQWDGQFGWDKFRGAQPVLLYGGHGLPSGYIAVYTGGGELLWTYQFFYPDDSNTSDIQGGCAITDVSIRVENVEGVLRDVVTYCGVSSFGVHSGSTVDALDPLLPFAWTRASPSGTFGASGSANNSDFGSIPKVRQWDGIVGRLYNAHGPAAAVLGSNTQKEFHSVVGGREQDGLWGLAELDLNRFVVVGSTGKSALTAAGVGALVFPFSADATMTPSSPVVSAWDLLAEYCLGAVMVFDAAQTRATTPGNLVLECSWPIGRAGAEGGTVMATHVRDVTVQPDAGLAALDRICMVGSTSDDRLFLDLVGGAVSPLVPIGGSLGADGFLLGSTVASMSFIHTHGTYQGSSDGGWCGVQSYSEFPDFVAVSGWVPGSMAGAVGKDLDIANFLVGSATPSSSPPGWNLSNSLIPLAWDPLLSVPDETPAAMGGTCVTDAATSSSAAELHFIEFGLGAPAGGGVGVDERARMHVVGAVDDAGFPQLGGAFSRAWLSARDGVQALMDPVPLRVGLTDGTGTQLHGSSTIPSVPAGRTGSTTPTCALSPVGLQIGEPDPALRRVWLGWEGGCPFGGSPSPAHFLIVSRLPDTATGITFVQFGVPVAPSAAPTPLPQGIELWVSTNVVQNVVPASPGYPLRLPLVLPPVTGVTFSAQIVALLSSPLACSGDSYAASPAIVFSY
jgi:hypothetical protein